MRLEKRILVVDDDDAIRALLRTVLRRRGFPVDAARNGIDALEQMGACRYALLILDLMMPMMSGYELLDYLARKPDVSRPRVLVLTAGLEPRVFDTNLVVGMIHKPFDVEMLIDTVTACMTVAEELGQGEDCPPRAEAAESPISRPN